MRLYIAAVGRLKDEPEREISDRYEKRFNGAGRTIGLGPLEIIELIESRAAAADARKADEAQRLLKVCTIARIKIALDVKGKALSSDAFANLIAKERDGGTKGLAFLLGGPDGHGADVLKDARMTLTLGPLTLPHGLARIVLMEQLYRAATILSGHPYHRG